MRLLMEITQDGERWVLEVKEWDDWGLEWRSDLKVGTLLDVRGWAKGVLNLL